MNLVLERWRRYGKDRLYVAREDGSKVGYWDLVEDEAYPESPDLADLLMEARAVWNASATSGESKHVSEGVEPTALEPESLDLAENRAGAEARQQALRLKEAAPVKTFLARALRVHTDERAWRIGADGEERVAEQLAKLSKSDERWRSLHAIPVGSRGSDIDHLAIGPGGVYTINAKNLPGANVWVGGDTLMVNGQRQPFVRNSRHEAARAATLLSGATGLDVGVTGIVVPVHAAAVTIKTAPADVYVVPRRQIGRWLRRRPDRFTEEQIEKVYAAARRSTTWA